MKARPTGIVRYAMCSCAAGWLAATVFLACSGSAGTQVLKCGPGTSNVDGECLVNDASLGSSDGANATAPEGGGSEGAASDALGSDAREGDTGSDSTILDAGPEGASDASVDQAALDVAQDPCATSLPFLIDCSGQCPATYGPDSGYCQPRPTTGSLVCPLTSAPMLPAGDYVLRTPSVSAIESTCRSGCASQPPPQEVNVYGYLEFGLPAGEVMEVPAPWKEFVSGMPLTGALCDDLSTSNGHCFAFPPTQSGYAIVDSTSPGDPPVNITIRSTGSCPDM